MPEEVVPEVAVPEVVPEAEPQAPAPEPAPEAPEAPPEPAPEQPRDEKGKFKSPIQERFDTLTRAKHEAEREAAYWRQRANPVQEEAPQAEPTAEQFKDYGDYVKAQTKWEVAQAIKADRAESAKETARTAEERAQQAKVQAFDARVNEAKTRIPDFDEVVGAADVPISEHFRDLVLDSEKGGDLQYYFAKNPAEATRISNLQPLAAAREMGRLEATLGQAAPSPTPGKPVTKAPAPMKPTAGNGTSPTTDPSKMSHEEYRAFRAKQGARWA